MKNHVWRPLFVVIGIVALILAARIVYVPKDFGAHERGYMYGWHRKANEEDWKKVTVKYQGAEYCENCHGPAGRPDGVLHPDEKLPKLDIDRSREHCLRCHFPLKYSTSRRAAI